MSDDLHVSETYIDGSHAIMACRSSRCAWVGHVDRSNAIRIQFEPQLDRCPRCGTLFYPEDADDQEDVDGESR